MRTALTTLIIGCSLATANAQTGVEVIKKANLPKKGVCTVCSVGGSEHGEEEVTAGVTYKGKSYYFCSASEVAKFKADPESFIPLPLPRPLPEVNWKRLTGESIPLSQLQGKVALVDFWATWCKPCVKFMPALQRLHDTYSGKGLAVVGVSIDQEGAKKVKPFWEKSKFTYSVALDDQAKPSWQAFGVRAIPALFLIDAKGHIVKEWRGEPKAGEVEAAVKELLTANQPAP